MKNKSLKEKFKNNVLVRPLYRKVDRNISPKNLLVSINVDNTYKPEGNGFKVKREILSNQNGEVVINTRKVDVLPGLCEVNKCDVNKKSVNTRSVTNPALLLTESSVINIKMIDSSENEISNDNFSKYSKLNKSVQVKELVVFKNIPDTWLRVFPLPSLPKETICSVILRCIFCQIGLATLIILWTVIWTFVIHFFEGPYEIQVSLDFEKEQNQLVIDLATELRQITPLSPKWRAAIESRIEEERRLTIQAVGRGVRPHAGRFWDLSGTFLFTVYVMSALGFGAPVPHTIWGRSAAIIYAFVAVPAHIYLMLNASTCLVVNLEACCFQKKKNYNASQVNEEKTLAGDPAKNTQLSKNNTSVGTIHSQNCSKNSDFVKTSNKWTLRRKLMSLVLLPCACRCVPLAALLYYMCGAVAFGVVRDRPPIDTIMFPLEFTTTGGLEHVEGYVRILYGLYVEGAMMVLSCALATLKRHSISTVNSVAESYRLFQVKQL